MNTIPTMSTAPRYPRDIGYAGLRMTADEYLSLGETHERYELIDGVVVLMSPSASAGHNEILAELVFQAKSFAAATGGARVFLETDVKFSDGTVYRPDFSMYGQGRLPPRVEQLELPPDLIVEVLSPGTKALDLITKHDDYERFGVAEYWAVDPKTAEVRCWRRQGARLGQAPADGDSLPCAAIPGFSLDLRRLRALVKAFGGD